MDNEAVAVGSHWLTTSAPTTKHQVRRECAYAVSNGIAQLAADTPNTFKEAMAGINKTEWLKAAQKEYDTAVAMNTWKVI